MISLFDFQGISDFNLSWDVCEWWRMSPEVLFCTQHQGTVGEEIKCKDETTGLSYTGGIYSHNKCSLHLEQVSTNTSGDWQIKMMV